MRPHFIFKEHPLTSSERLWLQEAAKPDFFPRGALLALKGKIADDFRPDQIDSRLYRSNRITPLGLWLVDPQYADLQILDLVIRAIRDRIPTHDVELTVTAAEIAAAIHHNELAVAKTFERLNDLSAGFYNTGYHREDGEGIDRILFSKGNTFDHYRKYVSLEDLLNRAYLRPGRDLWANDPKHDQPRPVRQKWRECLSCHIPPDSDGICPKCSAFVGGPDWHAHVQGSDADEVLKVASHLSRQRGRTRMKDTKSRPWIKWVLAAAAIGCVGAGIVYRIHRSELDRRELATIYPRMEQLLAIYSLAGWRSPSQLPPHMTEDSEWGGQQFQLNCSDIKWGERGSAPGELFSCFLETVKKNVDGEEFDAPRITSNEDYWYKFTWESLFGYQFDVEISPEGGDYSWRDSVQTDQRCMEEAGTNEQGRSFCTFDTYVVKISGLSESKAVSFMVSYGHPVWLSNGGVDRRDEWVVYADGSEPMTVGAINRTLQLAFRRLQFSEVNLEAIAPQFEAKWMNKDKAFLDALFSEIEKAPDLTNVYDFLKDK